MPLILAGLGIGATVAGIFGFRYWEFISTHQTTDNATVYGHIHQISSKVAGTVTEVLVNDNQQVQPGQLLAKLDPKDYENKAQQAQEGITSARAKLAASKGGLQQATASGQQTTVSRSQYAAAQSAIAQSQAALKDAQLQLSYSNRHIG